MPTKLTHSIDPGDFPDVEIKSEVEVEELKVNGVEDLMEAGHRVASLNRSLGLWIETEPRVEREEPVEKNIFFCSAKS